MGNLDLNKYQLAWKNEKSFRAEELSETEIYNFMRSASKIVGQHKRSIIFDIVFKSVLLISFITLMFLIRNQLIATLSNSLFMFITVFGIIWQFAFYKRIDKKAVANEHLKRFLKAHIKFYNRQYVKSIFVSALSSTLFFLSGSIFYLYFKYGHIPTFELDDFIVLALGIIASYGISAFAHVKQNAYQVDQLESCLIEIEEDTINASSVIRYKTDRIKNLIITGIGLIMGVIILLYLIFKLNN